MVLVHSDHVNDDKVLDVHIRTVIREWWSQIDSAAIRVGDVTLQVDFDKMFLNGNELAEADLPFTTEEFTISHHEGAAITQAIRGQDKNVLKTYAVTLNDKSVVTFKILGEFINVEIQGHSADFARATGLMGDFALGKPFDRNGERMHDLEEFCFEWQVNPAVDPTLFLETKGPQLPNERCRMPEVAKSSRRLRAQADRKLLDSAENACGGKDEYDACMSDILATGNLDMALIHA